MKTHRYKIYGCILAVVMAALIGLISPLANAGIIPLSDDELAAVTGASEKDMVCWNWCPGPEGSGGCDEGSSCEIYPDCPGGEFSSNLEASICVTSDSNQHTCTIEEFESVTCANGYICDCVSYILECKKYTYGGEGFLVYKNCDH